MAEETLVVESGRGLGKRKFGRNQGHKKSNKKPKVMQPPRGQKKVKIDQKMKKLYHKRAREYNSDDDDDENETAAPATLKTRGAASMKTRGVVSFTKKKHKEEDIENEELSGDEGGQGTQKKSVTDKKVSFSEDEGEDGDEVQPGITKFTEGCKAFKMAFKSIIKKSVSDDLLGPVLSAQKNLVIEKLAEEEAERKVKGEAKKEKLMLAEKGHVKPATYLDSHEKFLISVATKGVVKLVQCCQQGTSCSERTGPLKE